MPSAEPAKPSIEELKTIARMLRRRIVTMIGEAGSGHPGGSLSAVEILTTLYFRVLRHDPANPDWPERDRFIRGMVAWLGGRQTEFLYDRDARYAGVTHYTLRRMVRLAADGLIGFSTAPLRLATCLPV